MANKLKNPKTIALCLALLAVLSAGCAPTGNAPHKGDFSVSEHKFLADDDALNLYCLRLSYSELGAMESGPGGAQKLRLANGSAVAYRGSPGLNDRTDLRSSMLQPYPLEPERPDTPEGIAPGRQRPYEFFAACYGASPEQARSHLAPVAVGGVTMQMARSAASALKRANLDKLAAQQPELRKYLKPDGAFMWRKIAGEDALSAHSYGIAVDFSARHAPYWRWSRQMPHPMQKSYPTTIVKRLEDEGFIWGGKWHEYDLMHFEYRPELICKARMRALIK